MVESRAFVSLSKVPEADTSNGGRLWSEAERQSDGVMIDFDNAIRRSYLVCANPRTGSGLLCDSLWLTGLAGQPDEYFGRAVQQKYKTRWCISDIDDYISVVLTRTRSQNGVVGIKVYAGHLTLIDQYSRQSELHVNTDGFDALCALLPELRIVRLNRRDKVRQAVSAWRAKTSKQFIRRRGEDLAPFNASFDYDRIRQELDEIVRSDQLWDDCFSARNLETLNLVYEDSLESDVTGTLHRVLDFLEIDYPPTLETRTLYQKQADDLSEELVLRFHEIAQKKHHRTLV